MKLTPKFHNTAHFQNFWQQGNGKELLVWANYSAGLQNFEKYAPLYFKYDEIGDAVVKDIYLKLPYKEASTLISTYSKNPISENDNVPESLKDFFLQLQEVPSWFNAKLANSGARFCMRVGTNALIILRDFTLMGGYDFAYLNKPLIKTGALKKGAVKRLKDTLEFWVKVTRENGLELHSEAYELIVRTRLMHSYARIKIKENTKDWDYQNWGEPINTWDMIATYTGFSLVFMQGLQKLGIQISEEEELGVFHLWKYVGHLLGIPAEFLPENKLQATEQLYLWGTIQQEGNADSALLAQALLDENLESTIFKYQFQRRNLRNLHICMNWFLLDQEINERLNIPKVLFPSIFPLIIKNTNILVQKIYPVSKEKSYQKMVEIGNKKQMKVLADYIKHTPKEEH